MNRANRFWTKYYTREDMRLLGVANVRQLVMCTAGRILEPDCFVTVDGGTRVLPLWQLDFADVEFVEITVNEGGDYGTRRTERGPKSVSKARPINQGTTVLQSSAAVSNSTRRDATCSADIQAWLRR